MTCNTFEYIHASEPYFHLLFSGNVRKSVRGDRLTQILNKLWNEAVLNEYNLLPWSLFLLTYCGVPFSYNFNTTKAGEKATILCRLEK